MRMIFALILLCACLFLPMHASATEEYAQKTGKECSACHLDPAGGGELTAEGKAYGATLATKGGGGDAAAAQRKGAVSGGRIVHFLAGYLHLLVGILWFGTILYVHLVLKPQYAAGGLPKGEVRVGLHSMITMGITGLVLMYFRVSSVDMLLHTRFGILLLAKISLYLVMVLAALFAVLVIGPRLKGKRGGAGLPPPSGKLTAEELSLYDGKEGRPACFAFGGKIYDATASKFWKSGVHMGRHHAGTDLTEALQLAPHGTEQVMAMPAVGELVASGTQKEPLHVRVFFFLAYLNLSIVFVIVFIIALWRWW